MAGSDAASRFPLLRWGNDASVFHGEGAFWDPGVRALRYVDMLAGDVLTVADGATTRVHVGDVAALVKPRRKGGYIVATERGFALCDAQLRVEREIAVFDDPYVRMNEGACDARGRMFCGSMAYDMRPDGGQLYRLDSDLSVHVALPRVTIPNGLVWSHDGQRAFHADTGTRRISMYEYDVEHGTFGERETFIDFSGAAGVPDGMASDLEGGLWVAMWNGAAVQRYDRDGRLTATIPLPVTNVTSCAFGGSGGTTLFVTTSRDQIPSGAGAEPLAGRVFEFDAEVRGAPVHSFAG